MAHEFDRVGQSIWERNLETFFTAAAKNNAAWKKGGMIVDIEETSVEVLDIEIYYNDN